MRRFLPSVGRPGQKELDFVVKKFTANLLPDRGLLLLRKAFAKPLFYLLYSTQCLIGNGNDHMSVSLSEGGVALSVALGTGNLDTRIDPPGAGSAAVGFDDNNWHHVIVQRHSAEVSFTFCFTTLIPH